MTNQEAIEQLKNYHYKNGTVPQEIILAIEALKDERAKGKWGLIDVVAMPYLVAYSCPFCKEWGNIQTFKPNFCPNCGADMREADNV